MVVPPLAHGLDMPTVALSRAGREITRLGFPEAIGRRETVLPYACMPRPLLPPYAAMLQCDPHSAEYRVPPIYKLLRCY